MWSWSRFDRSVSAGKAALTSRKVTVKTSGNQEPLSHDDTPLASLNDNGRAKSRNVTLFAFFFENSGEQRGTGQKRRRPRRQYRRGRDWLH
jgi:hypothetical protein